MAQSSAVPVNEERLSLSGLEVRFRVLGAGSPLVYLHGANGAALPSGVEALASQFRVYLPEHPGFGTTERPEWVETTRDMALHYLDLFDALGLREVNLVGQSLGGWIAAELASTCAHHLRRLVLVAAAGLTPPGERRLDMFALTPEEAARTLFHDQALAERMLALEPSTEQVRAQFRNRATAAWLAWNARLSGSTLRARLRRIHVPTLIVWGAEDRLIPVAHASAYAESIPQARLALIQSCGHLPAVEQPAEFAQLVGDFLAQGD